VVTSQTGNDSYNVELTELGFVCSCPDHLYRGVKCKHIHPVEFSFAIREQVKSENIIARIDSLSCRYCSSTNIVKKAIRYDKYGNIQRYLCKQCGKRFSFNIGFEKMRASPQMITSAMQLYFTGESFRKVAPY
jgi:putative transposase